VLRFLRTKLTFSNLVALLALFIALGGAAYAATQLPKNSVGTKQLKKGAVTKAKIKKSTLKALQGARGPAGPAGPVGPAGGALPAGVTLRGSFALGENVNPAADLTAFANESFGGYALGARPLVHVVGGVYGGTAPAACPGTVSAPEAAPGNLCLYVALLNPSSDGLLVVTDPSDPGESGVSYNLKTDSPTAQGDGRVSRFGFRIFRTAPVATSAQAYGTWAVTG